MKKLFNTQNQIQSFILFEENPREILVTNVDRLALYRNGYVGRMQEILSLDYPQVKNLMGEDLFFDTIEKYLKTFPAQHFLPQELGKHLSHFLTDPLLQAMADFEYRLTQLELSPTQPHLDFSQLQNLTAEQWLEIPLQFQPFVQLLSYPYNIPEIWQNQAQKNESSDWLLWQDRYFNPRFKKIDSAEEKIAIQAVMKGVIFSELGELFNDETLFIALFQQWLNAQLLINQTFHGG